MTGDVDQAANTHHRWRQLGWHLAALSLICAFRFASVHDLLLSGVDGSYATFSQYPGILFTDPLSVLNVSPYFGFGGTFPGPSPFTDPFGLVLYLTGSVVAAYVLLAIIVFLSVFALARGLGAGFAVALACGWLLVVALLPVCQRILPVIEIAGLIHPSSTYVTAAFCIVAALFLEVGRRTPKTNTALAVAFLVAIVLSWINNLTFMTLALPFTAAVLAIFIVSAASWREAAWKSGCAVLAAGLFAWLGLGAFLDSFTAFSPRLDSMLSHTNWLMPQQRLYLLSLVNDFFFVNIFYFGFRGPATLGWLALAGMIQGLFLGNLRWRLLCLAGLGVAGTLTLLSNEYLLPGVNWPWAAPAYFERATFPIYIIAAVLLVKQLALYVRTRCLDLIGRAPSVLRAIVLQPRRYQIHALAAAVALAAFTALIDSGPRALAHNMIAAPVTFPSPDSHWRRFAELVPVEKNRPFAGWFTDLTQSEFDYNVQIWRSGGGTLFQIPAEDNLLGAGLRRLETITPLDRRFALLGAYGLAYVYFPALQADDTIAPATDKNMPGLFRVRATNIAGFTPTDIVTTADFDAFEAMVVARPVDWQRTVALDPATAARVGGGLVAARRVTPPIVVTNGLRVEADSDGRSLLLLPRQFSHCYIWRADPGSSGKVTVVRANMLQAALLFDGNIKGRLDYVYRWGGDNRCRAQDPAEARALGIRSLPITGGRLAPIGQYILLPAQNRAIERNRARAALP